MINIKHNSSGRQLYLWHCYKKDWSTGRAWNGMEWKMKWKRNFGMEYGRFQVWKRMEDFKNGMEWNAIFHTFHIWINLTE